MALLHSIWDGQSATRHRGCGKRLSDEAVLLRRLPARRGQPFVHVERGVGVARFPKQLVLLHTGRQKRSLLAYIFRE